MIVPRKLYRKADLSFCEEDDLEQAWGFVAKGTMIPDAEAEAIGLTAYLAAHPGPTETTEAPPAEAEVKAVEQTETENKAVEPASVETKDDPPPGLHVDRTVGRRGRAHE